MKHCNICSVTKNYTRVEKKMCIVTQLSNLDIFSDSLYPSVIIFVLFFSISFEHFFFSRSPPVSLICTSDFCYICSCMSTSEGNHFQLWSLHYIRMLNINTSMFHSTTSYRPIHLLIPPQQQQPFLLPLVKVNHENIKKVQCQLSQNNVILRA